MDPATVAARLLAAAVLVVAPTLLFLGLWRGMEYVRDERLVERVYGDLDEPVDPPQFDFSAPFSTPGSPADGEAAGETGGCPYCGRPTSGALCGDCRDRYGSR